MALVGWVDSCSKAGIAGWAGDTTKPNQPIAIDIYVGSKRMGPVVAGRYRHDLETSGHGDGRKAFFYLIPSAELKGADSVEVRVCFAGTAQLVPNGAVNLKTTSDTQNPWNCDKPYDYSTLWLGAKACQEYINRTISVNAELHPTTHTIQKYVLPRGAEALHRCRALLLGASEGFMQRELCRHGFTGEIVATDIANNALRRAQQQSEVLGHHNIRHVIHDLNVPPGDKFGGPFDFIFAEGVLHHIKNIGPCLEACNRLLKPDGLMFALEFEGPFRFQLSELQTRWINTALAVLPRGLRPFSDGKDVHTPAGPEYSQKFSFVAPSEDSIAQMDPSEALTGPEIKKLIPEMFDIVERKGFGGTLLSYMTCHFDFKRSNTDAYADRWLKVLMEIEHALIDTGILDDEFVYYVLKKKLAA